MKKTVQKLIATALVATSLLTISNKAIAFAETIDTQNKYISSDNVVYEKLPEVTSEELQKAINKAMLIEAKKNKDTKQAKLVDSGLKSSPIVVNVISDVTDGGGGADTLLQPKDTWVPDIHFDNKYVAQAVNTLINGTLIAIGAGSISIALKKYGAEQLRRIFTASFETKLIGKAIIALGVSTPFIIDFIFGILNPGEAVAKYLDSVDDDINNEHFDVIW